MNDEARELPSDQFANRTTNIYRLARKNARGMALTEFSRAELIRLIDFPGLPLQGMRSETIKAGRSSLVVKTEFPFGTGKISVAYKRIRRRNWFKSMTGSVRSHRAARAWRLGHALRKRGIDTPCPIAVVIPRKRRVGADAFLATEWVDDATTLSEFLRRVQFFEHDEQRRKINAVAQSLGQLLGKMHAAGVRHRDLKPSNLLIVEQGRKIRSMIVDLDGAVLARRVSRLIRCRNLSRLVIGTQTEETVTRTVQCRFLRAYFETSSLNSVSWKLFWRELERETRIRFARKQRRRAA
ncbi:MAG: hypothetical protein Tsb009_24950 [Planctomycetaceae bacterium]